MPPKPFSPGFRLSATGVIVLVAGAAGTPLVIAAQVRKPSYHGIAWQRSHPKLRDWCEAQDSRHWP